MCNLNIFIYIFRSGKSAASFVDTVQIVSFSNDDVLIFGLTHDIKLHVWNAVTHEYKGIYELEKKDYAIGRKNIFHIHVRYIMCNSM